MDLAKQYNVTPQTIRKWQNRDEFTDKSHRPHRLQTKLSEHQEMLVVELRKLLLLPLDDLLVIVREFIHPEATRSGIHRTLRRHGVSNLNALLRAENEEEQPALCMWMSSISHNPNPQIESAKTEKALAV